MALVIIGCMFFRTPKIRAAILNLPSASAFPTLPTMTPTPKKTISGVTVSGMFPFTSLYTLPSTALKTLSDLQLGHGIEGIPDPHCHIHAFTFSNANIEVST
jgi:hypothetical protein